MTQQILDGRKIDNGFGDPNRLENRPLARKAYAPEGIFPGFEQINMIGSDFPFREKEGFAKLIGPLLCLPEAGPRLMRPQPVDGHFVNPSLWTTAFFILFPTPTWAERIASNFLFGCLWFWWIQQSF